MSEKISIAFQLPDISEEYPDLLLKGAYSAAKELDITLSVINIEPIDSPYDYRYQTNFLFELLESEFFDAVILASCTLSNYITKSNFNSLVEKLKNKPLVSLGILVESATSILIDNKTAILNVIEHLVKIHEKKKIAFIKGPLNNIEANERLNAFVESILKFDIPFNERLIFEGDFSINSGEKVAEQILESKMEIDAIITANDNMAIGLIRKLKEEGIKIPEHIAVVGFDDIESAKYLKPSLSTIKQPIYKQGYIAVKSAFELIKNGTNPGTIYLPCFFMARESCGCGKLPETHYFNFSEENLFRELKRFLDVEDIGLKNAEKVYSFFQNLLMELEQSSPEEKRIIDSLKNLIENLLENGEDIIFLSKILELLNKFFPAHECILEKCNNKIYEAKNSTDNFLRKERMFYERNLEEFLGRIYTSTDWNEWLKNIMEMATRLKWKSFYIFKFLNPVLHRYKENFSKNEFVSLILSEKLKNNLKIMTMNGIKVKFKDFISYFKDDESHLFFVLAIYFREYLYGYIVIDGGMLVSEYIYKVASSLSNSFFTLLILERLSSETRIIKQRTDELENELFFAELLQKNILPKSSPRECIDFYFKYKERIGGDFFDFINFREKDWVGIFIADVSGHGVPTAIVTSALKSSILQMRAFLTTPSEFLLELNDTIYSMARQGFFVTAFYGIYKEGEKKLLFSNAGHNSPYLIYEDSVKQLECKNSGFALGIVPKEELISMKKAYRDEEIDLDNVLKIVFYTDGLTETSSKNNPGADFENYVLKSLFFNNRKLEPADFVKVIRDNLISFHGSQNFEDDVTFICLDIKN
ncbi:MAG: SpoIIE family protein phosphatase [Brevinematia bacterium]